MEERRLNFNAPLLSTRRFPPTSASPKRSSGNMNSKLNKWPTLSNYASDVSLDQVTEPASVPFTWEQIPGKPKDNRLESFVLEKALVSPAPPPGKLKDILKYSSEKDFEERKAVRSSTDVFLFQENMTRLHSLKDGLNEKGVLDLEEEDDVYSDALDTLSPHDSFSVNPSISGVSGYCDSEVKILLPLSAEPEAPDFMMRRFLPAAKAMTLEQPQYASKKQLVPLMSEQPRQLKTAATADKRPSASQYKSIVLPYYQQDLDNEESEDEAEDEVEGYDFAANISRRGCGLLPQLCFKNSLGMLKQIPSLKIRGHSLVMSSYEHAKSSKAAQLKSRIQSVKKIALDSVYKQKIDSRIPSTRLPATENKLRCGSDRFVTNSTDQLTASSRASSNKRSGCISPYRSARTSSPFRQVGCPGTLKEAESMRVSRLNKHIKGISKSQELLYPRSKTRSSDYMNSAVEEKTLYVDTENSMETKGRQNSNFGASSETLELSSPCAETILKAAETIEIKSEEFAEINTVENFAISSGQTLKADDSGKVDAGRGLSTLPPPLPKTPSDSWLLRNLPSVTSQNPLTNSYLRFRFNPKKQDPQAVSGGTKWETIVKTSYLHDDHTRYSKELITHASHQSKT